MIQPTMRGLESPATPAISPYVATLPGGMAATSERTRSTWSSVTGAIASAFPTACG